MKREGTITTPEVTPGVITSALVAPDHTWHVLRNLIRTDEGGWVNVKGPIPLVRTAAGALPSDTTGLPSPTTPTYAPCHGIFHARLGNGRDLLLLQTRGQIWEFEGWNRQWRRIVAAAAFSSELIVDLPVPTATDFPTQFCATPTGIIIIPAGGRALFYDGEVVLPLGYDQPPAAPIGHGPNCSSSEWFPNNAQPFFGINDTGYTMDGIPLHPPSSMYSVWRGGRIGTVSTPGNISTLADSPTDKSQVMGYLEPGRWQGVVQFIDRWGNLSPISPRSNDIVFRRQPAMTLTGPVAGVYGLQWVNSELVQKQIAWSVPLGPDGTIGRILGRTKDLVNSGDAAVYQVPRDASVVPGAFATLPDNQSRVLPDNIPDAWLFAEMLDVADFPPVKLVEMAFGRAFFANAQGDEGALYWSEIGRWGTILRKSKLYPDPSGAEVTCLRRHGDSLYAFTENSVFRIVANDAGDGFRPVPITTSSGTTSPNSVRSHRNGALIWLGSDGSFYGWDGSAVLDLWADYKRQRQRIRRGALRKACAAFDPSSGEYRCWVPNLGSDDNSVCHVFDGATWRTRIDIEAHDVCVTDDPRRLMIVAGKATNHGVFVLDRAGEASSVAEESEARTAWLRSTDSQERASIFTVYLHLRETSSGNSASVAKVQVRRDFRAEVVDTKDFRVYPALDTTYNPDAINPDFYDTALWGSGTWRTRRPFWTKVDIDVGSCECFQLAFVFGGRVEMLGYSFDQKVHVVQGAMSPRSNRS